MLPTFLGIGASRSGTTTLYDYLCRHNNVFMSTKKEIHYFTFNSLRCGATSPMEKKDYEKFFSSAEEYLARGEISPSYLWVPGTAAQISSFLPSVKLVAILRNPVERVISDFQHSWHYGINQVDLSEFISTGIDSLHAGQLSLNPFHPATIIWKGCYSRQLGEYLNHFDTNNMKVFIFEDMIDSPSVFLADLCAYLDIPHDPDMCIGRTNARPQRQPVESSVREKLTTFYEADVQQLERMLNMNLDHWLL